MNPLQDSRIKCCIVIVGLFMKDEEPFLGSAYLKVNPDEKGFK